MSEETKLAFEFARDTTNQLITLSTGIIALAITFAKEFVGNVEMSIKAYALFSWGALLISVFFGLWTLLALTGTLEDPTKSSSISIRGSNVTRPAIFQIITFLIGLGLVVVFGLKTSYGSHDAWDATTSVEKVLNSMPVLAGGKDSKWILRSLNWDASSKVYKLILMEEKSSETFSVTVDTGQGRIIKAEKP